LRREAPEVSGQGFGLGAVEAAAERRHARALAFENSYRELGVGPLLLPGRLGEVG
jgi:hypothetical protein